MTVLGFFTPVKNRLRTISSLSLGCAILGGSILHNAAFAADISGSVRQDYNADGNITLSSFIDDTGLADVELTAFNAAGSNCGTATSAADGSYALTTTCTGNGPWRVEITAWPNYYYPSTSASDVKFVNSANTSQVNFLLSQPKNYCQDNPQLATTQLTYYAYSSWADDASVSLFSMSDVSRDAQPFKSRTSGNNNQFKQVSAMPSLSGVAEKQVVGNIFGLAWHQQSKTLFASAFARGNSIKDTGGLGIGGVGGIYAIDLSNPASPVTTIFSQVTNSGEFGYADGALTGKVGLGSLALSVDQNSLYTVNLHAKTLVSIPINTSPVSAGAEVQTPLPIPASCPATNVWPFAVAEKAGKLYVGMTCDGVGATELIGYVYEYDGNNFSLKLEVPFNYPRPHDNANYYGWGSWLSAYPDYIDNNLNFIDWDVYPSSTSNYDQYQQEAKSQPWLVNIDFDGADMILGIRSRFGDVHGASKAPHYWIAGGDLLRACADNPDNPTQWTLENNASCGGHSTLPVPATDPYVKRGEMEKVTMGIGGTAYYWGNIGFEGKPSQGGLKQIPGYKVMFVSEVDAISHRKEQGIMAMSHEKGHIISAGNVFYPSDNVGIGKGNALGDVEALCDEPPLEIGNRVWDDVNANGIQDAGETGIPNVQVNLLPQGGGAPITAMTDAQGRFSFQVQPNTTYKLTVPTSPKGLKPTRSNGDGKINNSVVTDIRDSDAILEGTVATINYTTGSAGENNHSLDFGFTNSNNPISTQSVDLELDKSVSPTVSKSGDTVVYTLTLRNTGTATATNASVMDKLPKGVTFKSATGGDSYTENNGTIIWQFFDLRPDTTLTLTVTATVD